MNSNTAPAGADAPDGYRVDDLRVDVGQRCVMRGATTLAVTGLSFDLLLVLMRAAPKLISVEDLMERVWPGLVVGADTVSQRVRMLRQALGDEAEQPRYIASMRGYGYRLLGAVEPLQMSDSRESTSSPEDAAAARATPATDHPAPPLSAAGQPSHRWRIAVLIALVLLAAGLVGRRLWREPTAVSSAVNASSGSVAVLPFANLTGDSTKDYLGEGMAEELINTLTKVPGLKVPARTSSFAYKGRNTDIRQIAKDLGVGTILEGSVREAGKRLRITAQLINAQDGLHLWSETYDEKFGDTFKLQDELAKQIVQALQPNLSGAAVETVAQAPPTKDTEAYNLYLQGWSLLSRTTAENLQRAIAYFQKALARDSNFARAHAGMAEADMIMATVFAIGKQRFDYLAAAERAAQRALALDATQAYPHLTLAGITGMRRQLSEFEAHERAALSLAPNDGHVHTIRATHLWFLGRSQESLDVGQRAYALAPANPLVVAYYALVNAAAGRDAEASRYAAVAFDLGFPKDSPVLSMVGELTALRSGHYAEAAVLHAQGFSTDSRSAESARLAYGALEKPAQRAAALTAIARLFSVAPTQSGADTEFVNACQEGWQFIALMGGLDEAFALADRCLTRVGLNNSSWYLWLPELRGFRRDARFSVLLTRSSLMEYYRQFGPPDDCELKDGKLTCH